jgi:hypothetical protein
MEVSREKIPTPTVPRLFANYLVDTTLASTFGYTMSEGEDHYML